MAAAPLIPDASVLVKMVLPEPDSGQAHHLAKLFAEGEVELVVPSLAFYEVANALRFSRHRGGRSFQDLLSTLYALGMEEVQPSLDLLSAAADEAQAIGSSVYDAMYLVLAKRRRALMVTADKEFDRKARSRHVTTLEKAYRGLTK